MKLVEILARELEVWPEFRTRFGQLSNGELIADGIVCTLRATLAEDWEAACITRPQWQAERDRMKAMEEISKFSQEQDQLQHPAEPTYEQQLWDRVYEESWKHAMKACDPDHVTQEMFSHMTECAGAIADAFMAERAKRVGK